MEEWRMIDICQAYEVSSLGRIKRVLPGKRTRVGSILRTESSVKYRTATLVYNGERYPIHIHILVCSAFHGPKPPNHVACHLNGDSHDNRSANLMWATPKENERHKEIHGTKRKGAAINGAKLNAGDIPNIKARFSRGETLSAIAEHYGVYYTTIRKVIDGRTWRHLSHKDTALLKSREVPHD